jgi:hypothetical protein
MYVFFSTDRRQAGIYALMGRSVLARSDNGLDFTLLYEVSRYKFHQCFHNDRGRPGARTTGMCLYNADWPADRVSVGGIVMRRSKRPYGPWPRGRHRVFGGRRPR